MKQFVILSIVVLFVALSSAQRGSYSGSRPIGFGSTNVRPATQNIPPRQNVQTNQRPVQANQRPTQNNQLANRNEFNNGNNFNNGQPFGFQQQNYNQQFPSFNQQPYWIGGSQGQFYGR